MRSMEGGDLMYYDKLGNEIDVLEWGKLFENFEYKRISETTLKDGKWVSTVWLGLDHGFGKKRLIFETMVFPSKENMSDLDCDRYSTLKEAIEGHKKMVKKYEKEAP